MRLRFVRLAGAPRNLPKTRAGGGFPAAKAPPPASLFVILNRPTRMKSIRKPKSTLIYEEGRMAEARALSPSKNRIPGKHIFLWKRRIQSQGPRDGLHSVSTPPLATVPQRPKGRKPNFQLVCFFFKDEPTPNAPPFCLRLLAGTV